MELITTIGGLFSLAVFWHFIADWFPQSHQEAITKARDESVRAWHCFKYTVTFIIPVIAIDLINDWWVVVSCVTILFVTHYVIDSYVPVLLWAKYFRKDPAFRDRKYVVHWDMECAKTSRTKKRSNEWLQLQLASS